jgi:hypothetical protein
MPEPISLTLALGASTIGVSLLEPWLRSKPAAKCVAAAGAAAGVAAVHRSNANEQRIRFLRESLVSNVADDSIDLTDLTTNVRGAPGNRRVRSLVSLRHICDASTCLEQYHAFDASEARLICASTDGLLQDNLLAGTENSNPTENGSVSQATPESEHSSSNDPLLDVEQGHPNEPSRKFASRVLSRVSAWRRTVSRGFGKIAESGFSEAQKKPIATLASSATLAALIYTITHNG